MRRCLLLLASLACATRSPMPAQDPSLARAVVDAPDRSERDRQMDSHRKPVEMLIFFAPQPGQRVGEIGAGGGYSTELFARAVGPSGKVFARDTPNWDGPGLQRAWQVRLATPALANTTHAMIQWDEPFPPEANGLDAVYSVAVYHDAIAEKGDTAKMNAAVFAALKPGGIYAVIDNSAKDGTFGGDADRLHRVDEALVREEVQRAGFKLAGQADFLRSPADTRDWSADPDKAPPDKVHTQDRFALRFVKP